MDTGTSMAEEGVLGASQAGGTANVSVVFPCWQEAGREVSSLKKKKHIVQKGEDSRGRVFVRRASLKRFSPSAYSRRLLSKTRKYRQTGSEKMDFFLLFWVTAGCRSALRGPSAVFAAGCHNRLGALWRSCIRKRKTKKTRELRVVWQLHQDPRRSCLPFFSVYFPLYLCSRSTQQVLPSNTTVY